MARVHFVTASLPGKTADYDVTDIEDKIVGAVRSWGDVLRDALIDRMGEHEGNRLHAVYHRGFTSSYRDAFNKVTAISDIEKMEMLDETKDLARRFSRSVRFSDPCSRGPGGCAAWTADARS